jgi:predicted NAD-dependent protein-ADP-ribosyltransferase YbiA (DUF1768 family)
VEHCYQAQKSNEPEYRELVMGTHSPGRVKRLAAPPGSSGRAAKQSYFRKRPDAVRLDWYTAKLAIMERGVGAKFDQNPDLARMLLATGSAELVEDSFAEPFWAPDPMARVTIRWETADAPARGTPHCSVWTNH